MKKILLIISSLFLFLAFNKEDNEEIHSKRGNNDEKNETINSRELNTVIPYLKMKLQMDLIDLTTVPISYDEFPVLKEFNDEMNITFLIDKGSRFEYIQNRSLEENQIDIEMLKEKAERNLINLLNDKLEVRKYKDCFVVLLGGNFEASAILIDELWDDQLNHLIDNEFIVAIPARDILAFCDSESKSGIKELKNVIERIWSGDSDHLLSKKLYIRKDKKWVPYEGE